jgi:hypothetical protein
MAKLIELCLNYLLILFLKLPKISELSARAKKVSDTKAAFSIELFLVSWLKEVYLLKIKLICR